MDGNPNSLNETAQLANTCCVNHTVYFSKSYKSTMSVEVNQKGNTAANYHFIKSGTDNTCFACGQGKHYRNQCIFNPAFAKTKCKYCSLFDHYANSCNVQTSGYTLSLHIISLTVISLPVNRYIQDMTLMWFTVTS